MNRVALSVVFLALATGAAGGIVAAEKFVIALPNGYQMVRTKSGDPAIVKRSGSPVVPAPIKAFAVIREVVTGSMRTVEANAPAKSPAVPAPAVTPAGPVAAAPPAGGPATEAPPAAAGKSAADDKAPSPVFQPPPPDPNARYFVLNTKTGEVSKDLTLADWQDQLKKLDITAAPQLAEPILPK